MTSYTEQIDAIEKRLRTPDNPWGSGPDYWDKLTNECGKLWGITDQNRSKYINDSGVFIHTTKEAVCFGSCEIEIRIAAAPNGKYAYAVSYKISYCGGGSHPSVLNDQAYDDPYSAKIGAIQALVARLNLAANHAPKSGQSDVLKMITYLNTEQEPLLL
jgi:hypothetical protein